MRLRIKEVLKEKGMTSIDLANLLGCTNVWLSQIYQGNPTLKRLEDIARALNCRVSDLLDESTPEESTRPAGLRCPHCGKLLYLATRPEEEPRQQEPEPARSPEPVPEYPRVPEPERVINPEPVYRQDGPQLSIFED